MNLTFVARLSLGKGLKYSFFRRPDGNMRVLRWLPQQYTPSIMEMTVESARDYWRYLMARGAKREE
jgi:hypothetical protein